MTEWRGFIEESKSYMNQPGYWKEWQALLYLDDGNVAPECQFWTVADKRMANIIFWLCNPCTFIRFYWSIFCDWLRGYNR